MITCPICGYENPDGTELCLDCHKDLATAQEIAAPLETRTPGPQPAPENPGAEQQAGQTAQRGEAAATESKPRKFCPWCGTKVSAGAQFCTKCGRHLQSGAPARPGRPTTAPPPVRPPSVPRPVPSAPVTDRPKAYGTKISIPAAMAILLMLFMPWVCCGGVSLSGFDLARYSEGGSGGTIWLLPVCAVIALFISILALINLTWGSLATAAWANIAAGIAGFIPMVLLYLELGEARGLFRIEYGAILTALSLGALITGGIIDLSERSRAQHDAQRRGGRGPP